MFGRRRALLRRLLAAASILLAVGAGGAAYLAFFRAPGTTQLTRPSADAGMKSRQSADAPSEDLDLSVLWEGRDAENSVVPPPMGGALDGKAEHERVPFKLRGVIYSGTGDSVAFVEVGDELRLLGPDSELQGWKVAAIHPRSLVLKRDDAEFSMSIESLSVTERPVADLTEGDGAADTEVSEDAANVERSVVTAGTDSEGVADIRETAEVSSREREYAPPPLQGADARVRIPKDLVEKVREDPRSVEYGVRYSWQLSPNGKIAGYSIDKVEPGSLAARYGLAPGDRVLAVNGVPLDTPTRALELYRRYRNSDSARVTINRHGETKDVLFYVR